MVSNSAVLKCYVKADGFIMGTSAHLTKPLQKLAEFAASAGKSSASEQKKVLNLGVTKFSCTGLGVSSFFLCSVNES